MKLKLETIVLTFAKVTPSVIGFVAGFATAYSGKPLPIELLTMGAIPLASATMEKIESGTKFTETIAGPFTLLFPAGYIGSIIGGYIRSIT